MIRNVKCQRLQSGWSKKKKVIGEQTIRDGNGVLAINDEDKKKAWEFIMRSFEQRVYMG